MNLLITATISLGVILVLLVIVLAFYSGKMEIPTLGSRLSILDLDGCREYIKDIATAAGDTSLYSDFVLVCNFALTFRETCKKVATSRRVFDVDKVYELEDRFFYEMGVIRMLKDDGNTDYETLKQSIYKLSEIKYEMQRTIIELHEEIQP